MWSDQTFTFCLSNTARFDNSELGLRALLYPNLQGKTFPTAVAGVDGVAGRPHPDTDRLEAKQLRVCLLSSGY